MYLKLIIMKKNFLLIYALVVSNLVTAVLVMAGYLNLYTDWVNITIFGCIGLAGLGATILSCIGYHEHLKNPE
jgi:hypothetical protein